MQETIRQWVTTVKNTELEKRIKTGAVLTLAAAAVIAASGIPYVLNAVCFLLALGGEYELLRGVGSADARRMTVCGAICALAMFIPWRFYFVAAAVALAGFGTAFAFMMKKTGTFRLTNTRQIAPFAVMIPLFLRTVVEIRSASGGLYLVILVIVGCAVTDVAAYFTGRALGKKKLAPHVSPGKTVAGFVGGIVLSTVVMTGIAAAVTANRRSHGEICRSCSLSCRSGCRRAVRRPVLLHSQTRNGHKGLRQAPPRSRRYTRPL